MAKKSDGGKVVAGILAGVLIVGAAGGIGYGVYKGVEYYNNNKVVEAPAENENDTEAPTEAQLASAMVANFYND